MDAMPAAPSSASAGRDRSWLLGLGRASAPRPASLCHPDRVRLSERSRFSVSVLQLLRMARVRGRRPSKRRRAASCSAFTGDLAMGTALYRIGTHIAQ